MLIFRPFMLWMVLASTQVLADDSATPEPQKDAQWAEDLWQSLNRQSGKVTIDSARATIHLANDFYFLNATDAQKVLTEVWNSPPAQPILGMIIPSAKTPFDKDVWAVTIQYHEDRYVDDKDAGEINSAELLKHMQEATESENAERVKQGYEPIKLIGWVAPPAYDAAQHKISWAKEIQWGDEPLHTLNYHIRVLGRKGVLALNFIADIEQLPAIESQIPAVLAMTEFAKGAAYDEFDPQVDKQATYGLRAMVTGRNLTEMNVTADLITLVKKFGIFLLIAIAVVWFSFAGKKSYS